MLVLCGWGAAWLGFWIVSGPMAHALDANRALTQCIHRIWQTPQGLPESTITCVRQTQDGYLWLGTRNGLVRFDGLRFAVIRDHDGAKLENAWIADLAEDADHGLWIATDGDGLSRLQGDACKAFGPADGLPSSVVRCLFADRQGRLWAGTDQGLALYAGRDFIVAQDRQGWPGYDVFAICQDRAGMLWVGGEGGRLCRGSGDQFAMQSMTSLAGQEDVRALACDAQNVLWIGTSSGLVRVENGAERRYTVDDGLSHDQVNCLAMGRDHCVWVGTKDGLSRLRDNELEKFTTQQGLSQSTVTSICEDHERNLWVGTKHGLNQFADRRTLPFTVAEGLPSNNTGPIFQDRAGTIWAGTLDAGMAHFDGRKFVAAQANPHFVNKRMLAISDSDDGGLWIGTNQGLFRTAPHDGSIVETLTREQGLPSDIVQCICRDQAGGLWVGTAGGLVRRRDGRFERVDLGGSATDSATLAILDGGSYLLVSCERHGVYRWEDGRWTEFAPGGSSGADVVAFYLDPDGHVWMGTRGGGLRLSADGKLVRINATHGLFDDDIFGIAADAKGRLWMACSKGVFSAARDDLLKFAEGEIDRLKTTGFTPLDALRAIECQEGVRPNVCAMRDGRLWFSTTHGLLVVDTAQLQRQLPPTPVVIEAMVVNGREEDPRHAQQLGPDQTNLTFRYAALSYASAARITYRYRLDGFDKQWVDAGTRHEAYYTNLPPGDYRFRVAARNIDDKEYESASPAEFSIAPRFYQRVWFIPGCIALLALAAWAVFRLRVQRIHRHLNLVVAERARIARELHDTLMQGFSGITMEMQALASRLKPSAERNTLHGIIQDAGQCLREARQSVAGLRTHPAGLAAALTETARQLTETHDIRLKLQLEGDLRKLPADVEYNVLRIAQEAISNAVKHSRSRDIEVSVSGTPRELRLCVRDKGEGFDACDDMARGLGRYGLIGMRERARQIGADLTLESSPGSGTQIRVVLPMASDTVGATS